MKILIATGIYPPDVGGPATYSKLLFDELPKQGIEVGLLVYTKETRGLPKGISHLYYFYRFWKESRKYEKVLVTDTISVGVPVYLASLITGKPYILKIGGDYVWEQAVQRWGAKGLLDEFLKKRYGLKIQIMRWLQSSVARRAYAVIAPSQYLGSIAQKWGVKKEKIKVVYNAFDAPEFKISKSEAREKLNLSQSDKIIVSAGRLVPWKGFGALIEIMPEIIKKEPGAKLIIIGDGPEKKRFQGLANSEFLALNPLSGGSDAPPNSEQARPILFTLNLPRDHVLKYLTAADLFVLNTAYEGLSHQILEAMAIGAPIVTTDAGGNSELISDGEGGFLVKFNDKNALKSKILEVLVNPILASKLAENAQKKAKEFSMERMIKNTIDIILKK